MDKYPITDKMAVNNGLRGHIVTRHDNDDKVSVLSSTSKFLYTQQADGSYKPEALSKFYLTENSILI